MKTLIVYYSMSGNTKFASREIARELDADVMEIKPQKAYPDKGVRKFLWGGKSAVMGDTPPLVPYEFDGAEYDRIVIASPVWASSFAPPIRTFIKENRGAIADKKIAAVFCCSGGDADKAISKLKDFAGIGVFEKTLVLVDPKDKPEQDKIKQMREFAEFLK